MECLHTRPSYIWRRVHMRMLVCSGVHVCVYMPSLFEENGKSKTSRLRICRAWLYHLIAHPDYEILVSGLGESNRNPGFVMVEEGG